MCERARERNERESACARERETEIVRENTCIVVKVTLRFGALVAIEIHEGAGREELLLPHCLVAD